MSNLKHLRLSASRFLLGDGSYRYKTSNLLQTSDIVTPKKDKSRMENEDYKESK
jgi:hypothetical protein